MTRKAKKNRQDVLARQDAALLNAAKRIGHHGHSNFVEAVRQFHHMAITDEYAADLLARAGYPAKGGEGA